MHCANGEETKACASLGHGKWNLAIFVPRFISRTRSLINIIIFFSSLSSHIQDNISHVPNFAQNNVNL